jgi:hypothetical protein
MRNLKWHNAIGLALLLLAVSHAIVHADVYTPAGGLFSCHQTNKVTMDCATFGLWATLAGLLMMMLAYIAASGG